MLRDAAVAIIQEQLGFRSDLQTNIINNLQTAQQQLEIGPTKAWWLVSETAYIRTAIGEPRLPVPADFLEEVDMAALVYIPDTPTGRNRQKELKKDYYDVLVNDFRDEETGIPMTGTPKAYGLLGQYFYIFPTPDAEYQIQQIYYEQDTILSSNVENGWLKYVPYLLIGAAGMQIAGALRDTMAYQQFSTWENKNRLLLDSQNMDREMANMDMQMGGPH